MTRIQQKPIIHGRDHMPGGADPIPGATQGFTTYREMIEAAGPWAYWPLDGSFEEVIAGRDLAPVDSPPYTFTLGQQGPFTDDAGTSIRFTGKDSGVDNTEGTRAYYDFTIGDRAELYSGSFSVEFWFYPTVPAVNNQLGVKDYQAYLVSYGDPATDQDWGIGLLADGDLFFVADEFGLYGSLATTDFHLQASPALNGWNHVAVTYDGTTVRLYLNGGLAAIGDVSLTPVEFRFQIGRQSPSSGTMQASMYFEGQMAHVAFYADALDAETIQKHMAGQLGAPPGPGGWQFPPPPPDGNPITVVPPSSWTGGTDPDGYHYQPHVETIVLTDSSPGRFDVPPRTWTRVPFNTVHIHRQWQPTPGSDTVKMAMLPDDRGLSAAAANGVLLLPDAAYEPADPTPEQQIWAWCNPEYPILDADRLPNYTAPPWSENVDRYCRALRIRNASTGNILRDYAYEDGMWRVFFEWPFFDPADGEVGLSTARNDNPFPKYPHWPARPLHKNLPYPELPGGIAAWMDYYTSLATGEPGWLPIGALHAWEPGTKFVAEVWQDTPYLLRFTTAVYPHYVGYGPVPPDWLGAALYNLTRQPYMTVSYPFDPATIDHTTGLLL